MKYGLTNHEKELYRILLASGELSTETLRKASPYPRDQNQSGEYPNTINRMKGLGVIKVTRVDQDKQYVIAVQPLPKDIIPF